MDGRTIQISHIPLIPNKQVLVDFLEETIGKGSVCACNLGTPKSQKSKAKLCAFVQFANAEIAAAVCHLARAGILTFWCTTLTAQLIQKEVPRSPPTCLEGVRLHMGCQISRNAFCVLHTSPDAIFEFGFDTRKINLYVNEGLVVYKMEFSFTGIRGIHGYNVKGIDGSRLLLVQLRRAPRIYHKLEGGNDDSNHHKDSQDIQWIRTTDFTSSCSIGQSASLCLELPSEMNIAEIQENFAYYKESEEKIYLRHGTSFSSTMKLVPIINPPQGVQLPYEILFKINSLVQLGILSGPTLVKEFFNLLQPEKRSLADINKVLERLGKWRHSCYEPVNWLQNQLERLEKSERCTSSANIPLDNSQMYVYRVQITPSKVYFCGPEVNLSNRVTRQYAKYVDNFLRVSFVDENLNQLRSTDLSVQTGYGAKGRQTKLYERILSVLKEGIVIGNKKFEFLAFSTSQLRENSVWMFASNEAVTAGSIRKWMGNFFTIKNVAKCATRMGQSFSSSTETFHVYKYEIEDIPDIKVCRGTTEYIFSDGIGKICPSFAREVAAKCRCDKVPSAFQVRYGGYKGVVAVDPKSCCKLSLRPSMLKYTSENTNLDVLSWTKFRPCFLNRQIITLLSTLGVPDQSFEMLQEQAVVRLYQLLSDPNKALDTLQTAFAGDNHATLVDMLSCGYSPNSEPYLSMMLHAFRASKLLELRSKARIFVPKGACLMGCLDETRTLRYGEVFIQVSQTPGSNQFHDAMLSKFGKNNLDQKTCTVEGKVVVAKNPCLHPGDVRILCAINVPKLSYMVDCVVFPQQGERPHPNECSGSDLDGDLYFVSWEKSLIPPQQDLPMDYVTQPPIVLDREVTIEEIQEYFANYMINDSLGIISNSHTVFADQEEAMARSPNCLQLAELHSIAVDFPKTGIPAQIPSTLRPKEYPDFMEKEDKPTYESKRILGKLYRSVKEISTQILCTSSFTKEVAQKAYDKDLEVEGFRNYIRNALEHKLLYNSRLATLMGHYEIKNEAEILSGNISSFSTFDGNEKSGDLKDSIKLAVKSLKMEARGWFEENSSICNLSAKASAWYHVTYHPDYWGYGDSEESDDSNPHFVSFPWVVCDKLVGIKRQRNSLKSPFM